MEPINRKRYARVLSLLGVASAYIYVFYSHKHNLAYTILPLTCLCITWVFVVDIWLSQMLANKIPSFARKFIYALLLVTAFSLLSFLRTNYEGSQLKKYGVIAYGKVLDAYGASEGKSGYFFYASIEYQYGGKIYQQKIRELTYTYRYHDSLTILCSSHDPELFKVVNRKPGLMMKY